MSYLFEIQGFYTSTYGWEAVDTVKTKEEAIERVREYAENERVPFRFRRVEDRVEA